MRRLALVLLSVLSAGALACVSSARSGTSREVALSLAGTWRGTLASPGGPLPFTLEFAGAGATPPARVINGAERVEVTSVAVDGRAVRMRFEGYDAELIATLSDDHQILTGRWQKTIPGGQSRLDFRAVRGDRRRFGALASPPISGADRSVDGEWAVTFADDEGRYEARGLFSQDGDRVLGTFMTSTGDYRYLEGDYRDGHLRLSTFDGAHAFLFVARLDVSGRLEGNFWSRDRYHATWVARRAADSEAVLPDPYAEVRARDEPLDFTFSDLDGRPVSLSDERFRGKVVLVDVFGTWCPNCNDQAPVLVRWHERYRSRGLEIVGLAYEFTGDGRRDRRQVAYYRDLHGIDFPLLLAGTSDKAEASLTLPQLSTIKSYPTTIFVGRDRRVRAVHSGFAGPATGEAHTKMVAEMQARIEALLDERAP